MNDTFVFNFDPRVIAGYKAMHMPPQGEVRTPTPLWQGLGLSQTSPLPLDTSDGSWNSSGHEAMMNMTTSIIDATPQNKRNQLAQYNDIASILTSLGLEHHIRKDMFYFHL
jgi:protein bicaudal C